MNIIIPSHLQVDAELVKGVSEEESHNAGVGHPQVRTVLEADDMVTW
jgi:hypothetical protein